MACSSGWSLCRGVIIEVMTHNTSHIRIRLLHFFFLNLITEFERRENKIYFAEANTPRCRTAPYPRDAYLKNDSRRKGERAHL
jgi:hypothetical protein